MSGNLGEKVAHWHHSANGDVHQFVLCIIRQIVNRLEDTCYG